MKHHEVGQKYSAARRIFSLLSVSSFSGDETQEKNTGKKITEQRK